MANKKSQKAEDIYRHRFISPHSPITFENTKIGEEVQPIWEIASNHRELSFCVKQGF